MVKKGSEKMSQVELLAIIDNKIEQVRIRKFLVKNHLKTGNSLNYQKENIYLMH